MIRFDGVSKSFDHRGIAGVSNLRFEVQAGEVVAILGPNGSGKSTTVNLVGEKLTPDAGSVTVSGRTHVFAFKAPPQDMNVQEFLISKVTRDLDREKKVQLSRDLASIFEFTFQLRQTTTQLSSGQLQKVMMASELMDQPAVILMDEPFAHLDPFTRRDILRSFFSYVKQQETTVLWVTHDLDEAYAYADRILVMNVGKIVQQGTPMDVLLKPASLFVAQFLGYKNFCTVSFDQGQWITPWGPWPTENPFDRNEAILVIPPLSWELIGGPKARIVSQTLRAQGVEIEFQQENQTYWLQSSRPLEFSRCRPRFDDCILLPL